MGKSTTNGKPKLAKVYPVDEYPYIIRKPYADDVYVGTYMQAINRIQTELKQLQEKLSPYSTEARDRIGQLIDQAAQLRPGHKLDAVADPYTGVRYRVEIIKRDAV